MDAIEMYSVVLVVLWYGLLTSVEGSGIGKMFLALAPVPAFARAVGVL